MADPPSIPELNTPRLVLRRMVETDAPGLHAAYGDAEAMRFWDSLPSRDEAETAARIR
jgi:RimJ/RimL family protein N-acetyltransferase